MNSKVGIVGDGNVGGALRRGLERAGYQVRAVGKDPRQVKDTGNWADVVILAVPYSAIDDAIRELGDGIAGKPLVDVTNALTGDMQLATFVAGDDATAKEQGIRAGAWNGNRPEACPRVGA